MSCKPVTPERLREMAYLWDDEADGEVERMFEAPKSPDFTTMLKAITSAMETHPWWHRVDGTPLANDLPVRAAVAAMKLLKQKP